MPVQVDYNHFPRVIANLPRGDHKMSESLSDKMRDVAKTVAPVDTGLLKRSIHTVTITPETYEVVADTKAANPAARAYAHYVEYGTRYMAAQPYMHVAYSVGKTEILPIGIATVGHTAEQAARGLI